MRVGALLLAFALVVPRTSSGGAPPQQRQREEAKLFVSNFYDLVLKLRPLGIPDGTDAQALAPLLSHSLHRKMNVASACARDFNRRYQRPNEKPPFAWLELGPFTGGDERASPSSYAVEAVQAGSAGSYRAIIRLTIKEPGQPDWIWRVAPHIVREKGQYVIDDVTFLKERYDSHESSLSQHLLWGCKDGRWVGWGAGR